MCNCQRLTYLCSCKHKERFTNRCLIYQVRQERSCFSWCLPRKCRPRTRKYRLKRVCRDCERYFLRKYGEHHYKKFIDFFLEYKERNSWGQTAIDPRTVPLSALLKRQSAPPRILGPEANGQGNRDQVRGQPFQVHQPAIPIRQVNRPPTPIVTNTVEDDVEDYDYSDDDDDGDSSRYNERFPVPAQWNEGIFTSPPVINNLPAPLTNKELARRMILQQQAAPRQTNQVNEQPAPINRQVGGFVTEPRVPTPFPHNSTPSPNSIPDKVDLALALPPGVGFFSGVNNSSEKPAPLYVPSRKEAPLPVDPGHFVVGDESDEEWENSSNEDDVEGVRVFTPSPAPKYNSNNHPAGLIPELAHLALGRRPQVVRRHSSPTIQQPTPRTIRNKEPVIRNVESVSDISIVKKLTKAAKSLDIPNLEYIDYDGKWVPRVMTPPKGKRKTRTPPPSTAGPYDQDSGSYNYNDTTAINIAMAAPKPLTLAFVQNSPSHQSVTVPPPKRLDGILVPASAYPSIGGRSTREHAADRDVFFKERGLPTRQYIQESQSATLAPILVHTPKRRYSVAVQSCFCDDQMMVSKRIEEKCLSCRERHVIAQDMNMTWI